MPKTLLVISKFLPEYTGAAYRLSSLYKRLDSKTVEVLCTSTSETKSLSYDYDGIHVRRIVFPFKIPAKPNRILNAAKVYYEAFFTFSHLIRIKPDLLHIAGYSGATMAALLYGRIYGIPRLIELVTRDATPFQFLPGLRYGDFLKLKENTIIIAISQNIAHACEQKGLEHNIWCRPNPIDEKRFTPTTQEKKIELRTQLSPFSKDDTVICMVAKFMPQKNQIFLIDTLKKLPETYKLLLAGPRVNSGIFKKRDDAYFDNIQKKIESNDLSERIHICEGFVDAADYMKASDIYVMPQHTEGLGTPMLEAIACGIPVVANADETAFAEWIENGINGYLAPLDAQSWSSVIINAMRIPNDVMVHSSKNILSIASSALCDEQYNQIFKKLSNAKTHEEISIKNVT